MRDSIQPARLTRPWRAHLLAAALLLSVVSVAACTGSSGTTARGTATARGAATPAGVVSGCLPSSGSCYAPHLFRVAYGIQPLLDSGIDGRGETVTVLAPAPSPSAAAPSPGQRPAATDIRQDLAAFDSMFRLPAARIQVVTTLVGSASPWRAGGEEVEDTEIVHAVAPAATLRVVLLPSNVLDSAATATADMLAGLRLAVSGADVASISFSLGEHYFTKAQVAQMHSILLGAAAHHVTVDASSGDSGASSDPRWGMRDKEVSLPASDPLVLAVGGTALTVNPSTGAYISETAWEGEEGFVQTSEGSGGGFSHLYARPAYQDGVPGISMMRGVPDVAGAAGEPGGGLSLVFAGGSKRWIVQAGGTSASAPLWGGLIALAGQYAHHDLGFVNPAIYRIASSPSYHKAFHDITDGSNTVNIGTVTVTGYQAGPGWDPVTGWGSPDAQALIPLLARLTSRSNIAGSCGPGSAPSSPAQTAMPPGTRPRRDAPIALASITAGQATSFVANQRPARSPNWTIWTQQPARTAQLSAVPIRRYMGDRRSPSPSGHITLDIRVILAHIFGPICGDDHPYITRSDFLPEQRKKLHMSADRVERTVRKYA
jgi:subtilase family serine protease